MTEEEPAVPEQTVVILDYLPHGRADDDRPQYQKPPLAQGLGVEDFGLFEFVLEDEASISIGDGFSLASLPDGIEDVRKITYEDLSGGARSELEHAVVDLIEVNEDRFVEFYNEAGPISLRLHQLNLLSGIGDKLRDNILDQRQRKPFEDLDEVETRVDGLHDPRSILVDRILEEIRDEDVKYKLFAREQ